jgi:L-iditol 2-dehydrogenase
MRALTGSPVALVGMGADTVTLDVALVQGRELSVTGVFRYANTYSLALQLISSGAVTSPTSSPTASLSNTPNVP